MNLKIRDKGMTAWKGRLLIFKIYMPDKPDR